MCNAKGEATSPHMGEEKKECAQPQTSIYRRWEKGQGGKTVGEEEGDDINSFDKSSWGFLADKLLDEEELHSFFHTASVHSSPVSAPVRTTSLDDIQLIALGEAMRDATIIEAALEMSPMDRGKEFVTPKSCEGSNDKCSSNSRIVSAMSGLTWGENLDEDSESSKEIQSLRKERREDICTNNIHDKSNDSDKNCAQSRHEQRAFQLDERLKAVLNELEMLQMSTACSAACKELETSHAGSGKQTHSLLRTQIAKYSVTIDLLARQMLARALDMRTLAQHVRKR